MFVLIIGGGKVGLNTARQLMRLGHEIVLVERPYPDWTLHRLMILLYGAPQEPAVVREALALPLVPSWRALLERRLATGRIEDWTSRLEGPG